ALLVVPLVDMVHRGADDADPGGGVVAENGRVVEAVEHAHDDFVLLQHLGDGLGLVDSDLATVAAGVVREGLLELVGQADVIDHQAAGLVPEHAVDPGDRLHQSVAAHRLVGVHRVQAGGVEAGQPHIPDDHQPERVVGVLEPLGQGLTAGFVADVLLHSSLSAAEPVMTTLIAPRLSSSSCHCGRSFMIWSYRSMQIRRLMQTIIALPSSAVSRCSKCWTKSSATSLTRFSAPTRASSRAHLLLSFSFLSSSSPSVTSSKLSSSVGRSSSSSSILASRPS